MKCIEKIYRNEGCARNGHFVCPNQYIVPKKKHNASVIRHDDGRSGGGGGKSYDLSGIVLIGLPTLLL